ncbi:MAG: hotdog domain-containing protein [Acidimicrobiia bacterium]
MSGTDTPDEHEIGFTSELGLGVEVEGDTLVGTVQVVPELCVPEAGVLRPSVLLAWADTLAGSLATERTLPRVCMTVDLDVRVVRAIPIGADVHATGRILKSGRVLTFTETTFSMDGSDEPAAFVQGTFVASPRPEDVADSFVTRVTTGSVRQRRNGAPRMPVTEILGARVVAPGVVEADRHARILNWVQTVQGGAVALLAEEAALSLPGVPVPTELLMRYLRTVRVGPMLATARAMGAFTQVDVIDVGNDNRPAAVAVAR